MFHEASRGGHATLEDMNHLPQEHPTRLRALVTGATSGIGLALTLRLASLGVNIVLVARHAERLESVGERVRSSGVQAETLSADLATAEGLASVAERVASNTDPIDILINNAGFGLATAFEQSDWADEQRLLDVLVAVPLRLIHAAIPGMQERGRGWILNVSSMAAYLPEGTYSAAKAYLVTLSRSLRMRYARNNIRVTALCPGFVHTEFHERMGTGEQAPGWMWAHADRVAIEAIRGLRSGRAVVRSDWRYRALAPLIAVLPDRALYALTRGTP